MTRVFLDDEEDESSDKLMKSLKINAVVSEAVSKLKKYFPYQGKFVYCEIPKFNSWENTFQKDSNFTMSSVFSTSESSTGKTDKQHMLLKISLKDKGSKAVNLQPILIKGKTIFFPAGTKFHVDAVGKPMGALNTQQIELIEQ